MINYQKKPILVPIGEPKYIHHKATNKHNEVTVAIVEYAMVLRNIFKDDEMLNPNVVKVAHRAVRSFQNIGFSLNNHQQAPAFIFTVKGKTERRENDEPNQELANKIAVAKANRIACSVARRALKAVSSYYAKQVNNLTDIVGVLEDYRSRELTYIGNIAKE